MFCTTNLPLLSITRFLSCTQEQNIIRPLSSAWYVKQHISFSDVLTGVRLHFWQQNYFSTSSHKQEVDNLAWRKLNLLYLLARVAA